MLRRQAAFIFDGFPTSMFMIYLSQRTARPVKTAAQLFDRDDPIVLQLYIALLSPCLSSTRDHSPSMIRPAKETNRGKLGQQRELVSQRCIHLPRLPVED